MSPEPWLKEETDLPFLALTDSTEAGGLCFGYQKQLKLEKG